VWVHHGRGMLLGECVRMCEFMMHAKSAQQGENGREFCSPP